MASEPLRLRAEDEEDLKVVSACLQDAVVRVGDLAYLPKSHRFVVLLNRYCWELDQSGTPGSTRMRTGLHFDDVLKARVLNVRQDNPDAVVELLAIQCGEAGDGRQSIDLLFAGGGCIRLEVECIDVTVRDLEGPWPARGRPAHPLDGGEGESG